VKHRTSDNRRFCQSHSDLRSASGAAAPVEFLEKLAMLIPKPRINRVVYHVVLAPGAGGRAAVRRSMPASPPSRTTPTPHAETSTDASVVPRASESTTAYVNPAGDTGGAPSTEDAAPSRDRQRYLTWAELLDPASRSCASAARRHRSRLPRQGAAGGAALPMPRVIASTIDGASTFSSSEFS